MSSPIRTCRRCGERAVSLGEGGTCYDGCEGQPIDEARRAESIRRLHQDTARLLHRAGEHEEAAWHDGRASR